MRALILAILVLGGVALGTPAHANEEDERPVPVSAPWAPEDWIPVVGIGCYVVLPAIVVIVGIIAYTSWVRQNTFVQEVRLRPPPHGLVILRF